MNFNDFLVMVLVFASSCLFMQSNATSTSSTWSATPNSDSIGKCFCEFISFDSDHSSDISLCLYGWADLLLHLNLLKIAGS